MPWEDTPCELEDLRAPNSGRRRSRRTFSKRLREALGAGPDDVVMHLCNEPRCGNLLHLELGSQGENLKYAVECIGRWGSMHGPGEEHHNAKLTWEKVYKIRELADAGLGSTALGRMFGISQGVMSRIIRNERWVEPCRGR